jgi:hypothetical protein
VAVAALAVVAAVTCHSVHLQVALVEVVAAFGFEQDRPWQSLSVTGVSKTF